jgi:radical SAM superfamily enzyme YgiQ (UPF0313 family)
MGDSRKNIYLCQFSHQYGNAIYLPYSVGKLWAYAQNAPDILDCYENKGFVFIRKDPDETVAMLEDPDVVGFSTYVWNWEMSIEVARRLKAKHPNCLVVFGGPQVPNPDRNEHAEFCERFPFIDIAVHGEGEITFSEILRENANGRDYASVQGITHAGKPTPPRTRERDLNVFPSPYLSGVFDELYELPFEYQTVWETNRGCPYRCTFCDWGSMTAQKLYTVDEETLKKEIDLFGEKKINHVYMADANFGILPRDVDIARYLAKTNKRTGGYPSKVRVNYAKNSSERVYEIAHILNEHKLDKGITLSVQSMDETTLRVIKRKNLKYGTLSSFIKQYQRDGIDSYTEVILGLPGETYETFREGIETLLEASAHDSLWIYRCTVLPNAPMNEPAYYKEYGIQALRTPIFLNHTVPGSDPVQEYEQTVVETATMTKDEIMDCSILAWAVQTFHSLNLTQVLAIYARMAHEIRFVDFYGRLLAYAGAHPETMLGNELRLTREKIDEVLDRGGHWDNVVPEYSPLTWANEEASYLRIALDLDRFYGELEDFLDQLEAEDVLRLDAVLRSDLLRYQSAIVVKWRESGDDSFELSHSFHSFHQAILTGERENLRIGRYQVAITDPYDYSGDAERYAREIVFWGRRGGKSIYKTIHEEDLGTLKRTGQSV